MCSCWRLPVLLSQTVTNWEVKTFSIINKYYLGVNEAVKWVVEDNSLSISTIEPENNQA